MEWWWFLVLPLAGFACGLINTLAGSGSLITLPLLIFIGLPANVANGTNRIAILLQNLVAVRGFAKGKVLETQRGKWLLLPAIVGAIVGASVAVEANERVMRMTIAGLLWVMLLVILVRPKRFLEVERRPKTARPGVGEYLALLAVGFYGGFIQAGTGIFLLLTLVLASGYDLVRANALKVLIVLCFTPFALAVFVLNDQVHWWIGLLLATGNMAGAKVGTHAALRKGAPLVRYVLLLAIVLAGSKMVWDLWVSS